MLPLIGESADRSYPETRRRVRASVAEPATDRSKRLSALPEKPFCLPKRAVERMLRPPDRRSNSRSRACPAGQRMRRAPAHRPDVLHRSCSRPATTPAGQTVLSVPCPKIPRITRCKREILAPAHYFGFWLLGCLETGCRPSDERMELEHSVERRSDDKTTKNKNRSNQTSKGHGNFLRAQTLVLLSQGCSHHVSNRYSNLPIFREKVPQFFCLLAAHS